MEPKRTQKKNQDHISRTITLGEINEENVNDAIFEMYEINQADKSTPLEKREEIKVIVNSGGGDVYSGFAMVDAIRLSETPVKTIVLGRAMSMSLLIAAAGHVRQASANARFMYHEGYYGIEGSGRVHENELEEYKLTESKYDELLIEYTSITEQKLKQVKKRAKDWYFGADEALELGLIDEII